MKRILALGLILSLSLFGCGNEEVKPPQEITGFNGKIIEINEGSFLVEPLEGEEEEKTSDRFTVPIEHMATDREPLAGDIIYIEYDGEIMESYPAQIGEVYKISLIDTAIETEAPSEEEESMRVSDLIPYEGEIASFEYVRRSPESEDVILLEGEEAKIAYESFKKNEITPLENKPNPMTGGYDYYILKFTDGNEMQFNFTGALSVGEDWTKSEAFYECPEPLNVELPQIEPVTFTGNRVEVPKKEVNPADPMAALLEEVWTYPIEERNDAWGYFNLGDEEILVLGEKDTSLFEKILKALNEKYPDEDFESLYERHTCKYSLNEKKAFMENVKAKGKENSVGIVAYIDSSDFDVITVEAQGEKEKTEEFIKLSAEETNYPIENIKVIYIEGMTPVNPN